MIWKLLSYFIKPKTSNYHDTVIVNPEDVGASDCPFVKIFLVSQPTQDDVVALRIDYALPKGSVSHSARYVTFDRSGERKTSLRLMVGGIVSGGMCYMMNSIEKTSLSNSAIIFGFNDGKFPVSNTYSYQIDLGKYQIT
jgi:hypothetical protein